MELPMTTIVATLPKVELYCRITDAMDRFQATELAQAAGLPEGDDEAALAARLDFDSPEGFLAASSWQASLIRSPADLEKLAWRTTRRQLADSVVHAELAVDICALPFNGKKAVAAIEDGIEDQRSGAVMVAVVVGVEPWSIVGDPLIEDRNYFSSQFRRSVATSKHSADHWPHC